jgi:CRISPR-associated protein (TIGR02584 family)
MLALQTLRGRSDMDTRNPKCVLVATLGKSPGIVTTAIDALWYWKGLQVAQVHCLALPCPGAGFRFADGGGADPLLREGDRIPKLHEKLSLLVSELDPPYGHNFYAQTHGWTLKVEWRVVNLKTDDLLTEPDNLRFFQACAQVLVEAEHAAAREGAEAWLCIAGGRKSMSALAHTAAVFLTPSVKVCHAIVSNTTEDKADPVMHPGRDNSSLIELPSLTGVRGIPAAKRDKALAGVLAATSLGELNKSLLEHLMDC